MFAPAAKKLINIQATHPSSGCGTSSPPWASIRRTPPPAAAAGHHLRPHRLHGPHPPAPCDRWRLLTLYAHLEEYERTACRIVEQSAALLAQVMQTPETDRLLRQCLEQTRENTPRLMSAFAQSQTLSDQSITFLLCVMSFNSMRFLTGDDHITVIAGVLYWLILRLTEKYAANDEHLLACLKTLGDKSRLDILKLLKEQDRSGQELAKELGISQGTVSHHLNVLVRDEFIRIAKDGSRLRCSLAPEAIESMVDDIRRLLL